MCRMTILMHQAVEVLMSVLPAPSAMPLTVFVNLLRIFPGTDYANLPGFTKDRESY